MNLDKIFKYKDELEKELTFEEISKLYRELLYTKYTEFNMEEDYNKIHCYQILRAVIDIFNQMLEGRKFDGIDEEYLKETIKW